MTHFTAKPILSDAHELDDLIFNKGQQSLNRDLHAFVETFETSQSLLPPEELAKTFVQLVNGEQKLKSTVEEATLATIVEQSRSTQSQLEELLTTVQGEHMNKTSSFEIEKQAFLVSLEERKKYMEREIQRESDKLDEFYAKQTRESIYRNLVGGNTWNLT